MTYLMNALPLANAALCFAPLAGMDAFVFACLSAGLILLSAAFRKRG